jgi:hypothetical protein
MADQAIVMKTSGAMDGRALAFTAGVTFNGDVGTRPRPKAPTFAMITRASNSATIILNTTPYFLLTLQTCPDLTLSNWTTLAAQTPITSLVTFTDETATATQTQRFYRAFLAP